MVEMSLMGSDSCAVIIAYSGEGRELWELVGRSKDRHYAAHSAGKFLFTGLQLRSFAVGGQDDMLLAVESEVEVNLNPHPENRRVRHPAAFQIGGGPLMR